MMPGQMALIPMFDPAQSKAAASVSPITPGLGRRKRRPGRTP